MTAFARLVCAAGAMTAVSTAYGTVVFIDFGDSSQITPGNYNNIVVNPPGTLDIPNLVDDTGAGTGIGVAVSGFFNGSNTTGTTTPSGDAAIFAPTATRDNGFGHAAAFGSNPLTPVGTVVFSNLDVNYNYDFAIFGSRIGATDNRETKYSIVGLNAADALLNTSGNVSNIVSLLAMKPTAAGTLTLTIEPGPNNTSASQFWYIAALRMTAVVVPEPVTASLLVGVFTLGVLRRR